MIADLSDLFGNVIIICHHTTTVAECAQCFCWIEGERPGNSEKSGSLT